MTGIYVCNCSRGRKYKSDCSPSFIKTQIDSDGRCVHCLHAAVYTSSKRSDVAFHRKDLNIDEDRSEVESYALSVHTVEAYSW